MPRADETGIQTTVMAGILRLLQLEIAVHFKGYGTTGGHGSDFSAFLCRMNVELLLTILIYITEIQRDDVQSLRILHGDPQDLASVQNFQNLFRVGDGAISSSHGHPPAGSAALMGSTSIS